MGWRLSSTVVLGGICLLASPVLAADVLFGITPGNLVTIDPTNPSNVTVIGPHNLPTNTALLELTYDPVTDRLLGLATTNNDTYRFYSFNRATGQATPLGILPNAGNTFIYESTEFVGGARNQIIVSQAPTSGAQTGISFQLNAANPDTGTLIPLANNNRDNDFSVWDSKRDRFYATDPNASVSPNIYEVNLVTGGNTDFINISHGVFDGPGELAYSTALDSIFAIDFGDNVNLLWRIGLDASGNPATLANVGSVSGAHVTSIAFAPAVPEPASLMLFGAVATISLRRRK